MATEAEVLEKVGTYCTEKQYTLNDDFRSQFSNKFAAVNPDADINDENVLNSIKFNLDTAFSAASKGIEAEKKKWDTEKTKLNNEIENLKKNQSTVKTHPKNEEEENLKLPEDVKKDLDELKMFKAKQLQQEKRAEVLELAKKNVRQDLHKNLSDLLDMTTFDYSKDTKELAKQLNENFTKLYKNNIGDIRPASPETKNMQISKILDSVSAKTIK